MTLCTFQGRKIIFMFGGFSAELDRAVSDLIAVDVDLEAWWYIPIRGGGVTGRIDAAIIEVADSLYIFGGRSEFGDGHTLSSYCVADFADGWYWLCCDRPYPD